MWEIPDRPLEPLNILLIGPFRVGKTHYARGVTSILGNVFNDNLIICAFDHNCTQTPDDVWLPQMSHIRLIDFPGFERQSQLDLYWRMALKIIAGYRFPPKKTHTEVMDCMSGVKDDDICFLPPKAHLKVNSIFFFVDYNAPEEFSKELYKRVKGLGLPMKVIITKMQEALENQKFKSYANFREGQDVQNGIDHLYEKLGRVINKGEMYPVPAIMGVDDFKTRDLYLEIEMLRPLVEIAESKVAHSGSDRSFDTFIRTIKAYLTQYLYHISFSGFIIALTLAWKTKNLRKDHVGPANGNAPQQNPPNDEANAQAQMNK
jgi:Reverse gyrase